MQDFARVKKLIQELERKQKMDYRASNLTPDVEYNLQEQSHLIEELRFLLNRHSITRIYSRGEYFAILILLLVFIIAMLMIFILVLVMDEIDPAAIFLQIIS